jgi:hypothetical protein
MFEEKHLGAFMVRSPSGRRRPTRNDGNRPSAQSDAAILGPFRMAGEQIGDVFVVIPGPGARSRQPNDRAQWAKRIAHAVSTEWPLATSSEAIAIRVEKRPLGMENAGP